VPRRVGTGLVTGAHGISEPCGEVVAPGSIDLVLVPGLAYTLAGARLGQGGGHYDRFLPTLAASCTSVGVCFVEQLLDELPTESHDGNVDRVVVDALPE
jgi:5-formyltetrahydrofolate cyclo-ligase